MKPPIVLDIDRSVGPLPGQQILPLTDWQEALRFGCSLRTLRRFSETLENTLPADYGTVFMGSGDFHHLSWPLIARLKTAKPFQVIVLDNHPDNMRFPFGVHCGSWVRRVAMLPQVSHVHVFGITSHDIGAGHAWENYLTPLRKRKLSYWCMDVDVDWAKRLGFADAFHRHDNPEALLDAFIEQQRAQREPTYLSIDKDVFAADVARTNWDQGRLQAEHALALIDSLRHGLVGSDINGEISSYRYKAWWKRKLSAMDDQPEVDLTELAGWQAQQHALNLRLLDGIDRRKGGRAI